MKYINFDDYKLPIKEGYPRVMGIVNCTPDSFYDKGRYLDLEKLSQRVIDLDNTGTCILDVGFESTRPGFMPLSHMEELVRLNRFLPTINKSNVDMLLSIDTYKYEVAKEAVAKSAQMINDVSGLRDPRMVDLAREYNLPVCVMHSKGQYFHDPVKGDVIDELKRFFESKIELYDNLILDPGFGFGKTPEQNYEILENLSELTQFGKPILVGTSHKRFFDGKKKLSFADALCLAIKGGADIVRVHHVKETKEILDSICKD